MFLYEEYLKRHKIKNVYLAQYCDNASFLFKCIATEDKSQNWKILKISWTTQSRQPGSYLIEIISPVHDGYRYFSHFDSISREFLKWEEYESNIIKKIHKMRNHEFIVDPKEVFISFWKMFVYVFDSWFSDQPTEVQHWLFRTIDPSANLNQRIKEIDRLIKFLEQKHPWVYNHWVKSFLSCVENYAYWIGKLPKQDEAI